MLRPYSLFQHQSHFSQRPRHPRALGGGARGRDQHPNLPRQQQLQRLHALAGDLEVRLFGAQRLTLRVQRHRGPRQRPQVRKPPLRIGRRGCDHDEHALRESPRERGHQHGGTRAGEAGDAQTGTGRGQPFRQRPRRRQRVQPVDHEVERHQRVRVATPSSTSAKTRASTSSSPLASWRPAPANRATANAVASSTSAPSTSRTSAGSPFSVASTVVSLLIPRPASPVTVSIRYLRVTCTPLIPGTAGPAMTPGVPASAKRQRPPPAASARFTWPINAGSAGGTTTLTLVPACGRSPMATSLPPSPPARTRFPSSSTASAAATNGPPPALGGAATRAGGATRHTSNRRSSARSSSASRTTSPTHQPGPSDGNEIDTVDPVVASARPTSRPRIRSVTGAAPPSRPAPGVPTMPTAAAPSVTRTVPTPRFGAAWLGGARASTRTPRGTAARPDPSAVRCRSLTTCTSRAGSGSASTRRVAAPTAAVRSSRRAETPTLSTVASNASLVPARATPSASTSQR